MSQQPTFFQELRRRRVVRAALVYAVVAFVVAQVADLLFPALMLPEWTTRFVVALLLLGFPVALVLAWSFELRPEGVRRAPPTPRADRGGGGRLSLRSPRAAGLVGLGMVIALVAFGGYQMLAPTNDGAARGAPAADARHSIAVLPFTSLAGGEENEYFADGLTEDILTNLGLVPDFTVVSRTSVMRYKGSSLGIRDIAGELGVRYILEGSMRRAGDQVRVVIQLVEPAVDRQIWARTMDRRVEDVFALQSEVAHAVVEALRVELGAGVGERIARAPTDDFAAYELFLHGRDFYYQYTRPTMERAMEMFQGALDRDPEFALAHAWLGAARAVCAYNYGCDSGLLETGLASARRAVELQPDLADAHRALGTVLAVSGQLAEAVPHLERAVELNPNDYAARANLGLAYSHQGEWDRALDLTRQSIERDPVRSWVAYGNMSGAYRVLGMMTEARAAANQALALRINYSNGILNLAWVELMEGRPAEAAAVARRVIGEHSDPRELTGAADIFVAMGDFDTARPLMERAYAESPVVAHLWHAPAVVLAWLLRRDGEEAPAADVLAAAEMSLQGQLDAGSQNGVIAFALAGAAMLRGQRDEALTRLEQAVDMGFNDPTVLPYDPILAPLRDEARYQTAVQRMERRIEAMRDRVQARQ